MAYNAATAAANREAREGNVNWIQELVLALRQAIEPEPSPPAEIVTVGETSDSKLDQLIYCHDCLPPELGGSKDGSPWMGWMAYWWAADETRPGQLKRVENPFNHPNKRKKLSYDARAVREGLEKGTHGKQCLQCGNKLKVTA